MPFIIWMTGLPSSGKSTLAKKLKEKISNLEILDGDSLMDDLVAGTGTLSDGLGPGWSKQGRLDHTKRVAYVAKTLLKHSIPVCVAVISPFYESRETAKIVINDERLIQTYVKCSLEICETRDVKGMYKKARDGGLENFTGVTGEYEIPDNPDLIIDTGNNSVDDNIKTILSFLKEKKLL
jgi:adenylylsulfate kinase